MRFFIWEILDDYIAYERNQKMLRDEQRRDYKRFAAEVNVAFNLSH